MFVLNRRVFWRDVFFPVWQCLLTKLTLPAVLFPTIPHLPYGQALFMTYPIRATTFPIGLLADVQTNPAGLVICIIHSSFFILRYIYVRVRYVCDAFIRPV